MKLGFTGTQEGMTQAQRWVVEGFIDSTLWSEMHNGDCVGADLEAACVAWRRKIGGPLPIVLHPPLNPQKRANIDLQKPNACSRICSPRDYLDRNRDIVDESEVLLATPKSTVEEIRSGTWYTIRYARKLRRPICIVFPDGSLCHEAWEKFLLLTQKVSS